MYLKDYQITDISQVKPCGGRSLETDIYEAHTMGDKQNKRHNNSKKAYTYLNRPLRQSTDKGLHLLHPKINSNVKSGHKTVEERGWSQEWDYNRENIPNTLISPEILKEHNLQALNYSIQEINDYNIDFLKYQNNHIVKTYQKLPHIKKVRMQNIEDVIPKTIEHFTLDVNPSQIISSINNPIYYLSIIVMVSLYYFLYIK